MNQLNNNLKKTNTYFTYLEDYEESKKIWLIEGLLCNGLTLLSGQPKSGKSALAAHLATSLLTGVPILNKDPKEGSHKIGWVGFDSNWKEETKSRLGDFKGKVIFFEPPSSLTVQWNWNSIATTAKEHNCTLMVIDHLYGLSENSNLDHAHEANVVLQKIRPLYKQYDLPTLLIAQAGKGANGRAAHSVHLEGEARHLLQLAKSGSSGTQVLKTLGNNSSAESFSIKLTPERCELASTPKIKIDKPSRLRLDSNFPKIANTLLNKASISDKGNMTALARFDIENQISGRTTIDSSRTFLNNLKKAGLLAKDMSSSLIAAGPKLIIESELN